MISGTRTGSLKNVDINIVRKMNTGDLLKDAILDYNARDIVFAFGKNDTFTKHKEY